MFLEYRTLTFYATFIFQTRPKEYYVVTDEATMISPAAIAYGEQVGTSPILLVADEQESVTFVIARLRYRVFRFINSCFAL